LLNPTKSENRFCFLLFNWQAQLDRLMIEFSPAEITLAHISRNEEERIRVRAKHSIDYSGSTGVADGRLCNSNSPDKHAGSTTHPSTRNTCTTFVSSNKNRSRSRSPSWKIARKSIAIAKRRIMLASHLGEGLSFVGSRLGV
jgi:hypothetical protein